MALWSRGGSLGVRAPGAPDERSGGSGLEAGRGAPVAAPQAASATGRRVRVRPGSRSSPSPPEPRRAVWSAGRKPALSGRRCATDPGLRRTRGRPPAGPMPKGWAERQAGSDRVEKRGGGARGHSRTPATGTGSAPSALQAGAATPLGEHRPGGGEVGAAGGVGRVVGTGPHGGDGSTGRAGPACAPGRERDRTGSADVAAPATCGNRALSKLEDVS